MGIGEGRDHGRPRMRLNRTRGSRLCNSFFLLSGLLYQEALSGNRTAEHTMQQPGKQKAMSSVQVVSITSSILVLHIIPQHAPGGGHVK